MNLLCRGLDGVGLERIDRVGVPAAAVAGTRRRENNERASARTRRLSRREGWMETEGKSVGRRSLLEDLRH